MKRNLRNLSTVALAVGLLTPAALATPAGWTTDYDAARDQAASSDKDLLLDFTGSDWCGWCIKLREEVFDKEAFQNAAPDDFVMVELDFPNDVAQSDEVKAQNAALNQKFNIQGYPTIILADATGKPYAKTGYEPGGADAYLAHLGQLQSKRKARDQAMNKADSAQGLEKAKALDEAMQAVGIELAANHYGDTVKQIIELDANNEAGLKEKYETVLKSVEIDGDMQEAIAMLSGGDMEGGLARLDQVIKDHNPKGEPLQMITAVKGQVQMQMGNMQQAAKLMQDALEAAPDSQIAPQIAAMIQQLQDAAPAQ